MKIGGQLDVNDGAPCDCDIWQAPLLFSAYAAPNKQGEISFLHAEVKRWPLFAQSWRFRMWTSTHNHIWTPTHKYSCFPLSQRHHDQSINQSINQPTNERTNKPIDRSINQSINQSLIILYVFMKVNKHYFIHYTGIFQKKKKWSKRFILYPSNKSKDVLF